VAFLCYWFLLPVTELLKQPFGFFDADGQHTRNAPTSGVDPLLFQERINSACCEYLIGGVGSELAGGGKLCDEKTPFPGWKRGF
jgi:hypothetical protein